MSSLASKDFNQALLDLKAASSKIDKAGARRVLHPNTAARRKSKLARAYAAALQKSKQAQA
jgi:small subunit ribosomal protein S20